MPSPSEIAERARKAFGEPNRGMSSQTQLRFGKKGAIAVELAGKKAGLYYDHESREGGSLLKPEELPERPERTTFQRRPLITYDSESADSLARALTQIEPAADTAVELYLRRRGITDWPTHSIRFCRNPYGLIGLAQDISGGIKAAQIVYLTSEGHKAKLTVQKRTLTACTGWHYFAAVRMPGRGEPILCEGIETGLSIWCSLEPKRPVYACLGPAGLRELRVRAKRFTIARDGDAPDSPADRFLQKTLAARAKYHRVRLAVPPQGQDFNDVLLSQGPEEVARLIKEADHG